MNYENMWNKLKLRIANKKDYYGDGRMCSLSESVLGEKICSDILLMMKDIEKYDFDDLIGVVDICPCTHCPDSERAYCISSRCQKYKNWIHILKEV